jgi:hypothetical protein
VGERDGRPLQELNYEEGAFPDAQDFAADPEAAPKMT